MCVCVVCVGVCVCVVCVGVCGVVCVCVCVCVSELKEYFSILQHQVNNFYKTCNFHSDQYCDQLVFYSKFIQPLAHEGINLFWACPVSSNSVHSQTVKKSAQNSLVSCYTAHKWEGCKAMLGTPDPWKMNISSWLWMLTDFWIWDAKVYYNVLFIYAVFNDSLGSASYGGGGMQ